MRVELEAKPSRSSESVTILQCEIARSLKLASAMHLEAVHLFGIDLHRITMREAIAELLQWMSQPATCRYVVTPNVDHVVKLQSDPAMQAAYRDAALTLADGWPIVDASRLLGKPLPERVTGSDLVPGLFAACHSIPGIRVFLLGAAPGVAAIAAEKIREQWPHVDVCGVASPPWGFEADPDETNRVVEAINSAAPQLLVVGLGAPRQEVWLHQNAARLRVHVAIAAGGTIDFLAGAQKRAPVWMQHSRLEWLFRLALHPRRLGGRYFRDAIVFPQLVVAEWRRLRNASRQQSCGSSHK